MAFYVWKTLKEHQPELWLLKRPGKMWLLKVLALYTLSMLFIFQGYYMVSIVITVNTMVQAILLERLWGRGFWIRETGGLMKQTKNYIAKLEPHRYEMKA